MADKLHGLRAEFVKRCNIAVLQQLLDDLQEEGILNSPEVESIVEGNSVCSDKCRALVDMVKKKGDFASNVLIQHILQRDQTLSKTLGITAPEELPLPTQEQKNIQPSQKAPGELPLSTQEQKTIQPSQTEVNGITLCSENEYQEIIAREKEIYPIRLHGKGTRTRLALIICNIKFDHLNERLGAECDLSGMKSLLEGLGYKVQYATNLTTQVMRDTMKTFAAESQHKESDSTFLVFMSHGEKDVICGTDSQKIEDVKGQHKVEGTLHVDEIFNSFNNVNCSGLRDKPKVIIIQACRGDEKSKVMVSDSTAAPPSPPPELDDDVIRMVQKERDFICFYSTTPDTLSWRCKKTGSLFIQRLIKDMKQDAHCSSLEDIFRKVQYSFKDDVQMPTQERKTLMKKFFLFPGL
ncbi:caspase-1-A-like [Pseudophryne corroboree]|uniref:caspase-1-A-like n=1 Tax=Pseudophryne corroboree TaxID=495146 RepID=UPI0030821CD1